jgi:hypothetical protein
MIGLGALDGELGQTECSRAQCREAATWRLDWRNPRIHTVDRVKTWLACDEHVDYLREFLAARDFPLTVSSVDAPQDNARQDNAPENNARQENAPQDNVPENDAQAHDSAYDSAETA